MMGHVIGQYVAQQLPIIGSGFTHLGQLAFRVPLPQEVQPGCDLHQPGVIGHQHQEHDQQQHHLRRQRHRLVVGVVLRKHLRVGQRREPRVHGHHYGGQERFHQEVQLKRGGQGYQTQHPSEHQVLRMYAAVVGGLVVAFTPGDFTIPVRLRFVEILFERSLPYQMFVRRKQLRESYILTSSL